MSFGAKTSPERLNQIRSMLIAGSMSQREISRVMGCSRDFVHMVKLNLDKQVAFQNESKCSECGVAVKKGVLRCASCHKQHFSRYLGRNKVATVKYIVCESNPDNEGHYYIMQNATFGTCKYCGKNKTVLLDPDKYYS